MKGRNMGKKDYRTYLVIGMIAAAVCLFVIKFDFLVSLASLAMEAAFPLLLGCVVAYAVNIPLKRLERLYFPNTRSRLIQKTRRPVCIVLSFVFLTGVVFLNHQYRGAGAVIQYPADYGRDPASLRGHLELVRSAVRRTS